MSLAATGPRSENRPVPARPTILRNRPLYWSAWLAVAASIALLAASIAVRPDQALADHIALAALALGAAAVFLRATRLRVELTGRGATVHKLLSSRTIPWYDVEDVTADRLGLHIRATDGTVVTAASMGTSPWASWLNTDANGEWVRRVKACAESRRPGG